MSLDTKSRFYSFIIKGVSFDVDDKTDLNKQLAANYIGMFVDAEVTDPTDSEEENVKKAQQVVMNEIAIDAGRPVLSCELSRDLTPIKEVAESEDDEDDEDDYEDDGEDDEDEEEGFTSAPGVPPAPKLRK